MFPSILIVDDEPSILKSLHGLLTDEGFAVTTATNGYEALKIIDAESPDLVLLDIWMPGIDGIETLKEIKKENPFIQVIIITGHGTVETAVTATKIGAFDLIEKPLSIDKIIVAINNALNFRRLEEENRYLRRKTIEKNSITGNSPAIAALKKQISIAAPTDAWILITGENGTGKELVAKTIHQLSHRSEEPLIDLNCAAIPEETIAHELLGYEKGAFAGATIKNRGKFELASKGTLFLDEIGDMSLKTQSIILRVLQEQKFQRIGGSRILDVDIRVIAASNKDLEVEIEKGNFREDLYYRLNVIPVTVPPLRDRIEDIAVLMEIFLDDCAKHNQLKKKKLSPDALKLLCDYDWPGNVRELKNMVERLAIMVKHDTIKISDIPAPYNHSEKEKPSETRKTLFAPASLKDAQKAFEAEFIRQKLSQHNNDIDKTAKAINVSLSYLKKRVTEMSI